VNTDVLSETTQIFLNMEYTNKKIKFKINAAVQKETPQVINFFEIIIFK
jgi:hypothetical protein